MKCFSFSFAFIYSLRPVSSSVNTFVAVWRASCLFHEGVHHPFLMPNNQIQALMTIKVEFLSPSLFSDDLHILDILAYPVQLVIIWKAVLGPRGHQARHLKAVPFCTT